jgi:hypothetical protein
MKASMGATRARLVPDPERAPWVTRIFEWRVYEQVSADTIAQRLHRQGAPSKDGKPWTPGGVYSILRNPKYTGRVVIGRRRNVGTGKRAGERKMRAVPREHWTWADDANAHPALISMDLWEAAQTVGRQRGNVQDHQDQRPGRADYPLRARIRCAQCNRRMCGHQNPGRSPGKDYYYVCPHNPQSPRDSQAHPGHVRAAVRERVIHGAIDHLLATLLSRDRKESLGVILPATAAEHDQQAHARTQELRRQIAQNETAQNGLITQLERLGGDTSPAAEAMRQRITSQFTDRYNQARDLQAQLDQIQAAQPPANDPSLLDELPYAAANLADLPDDLKAKLYAAFGIQVLYRAHKNQATIWATITDATPGIAAALTERAADDTACGNLASDPIWPERHTMIPHRGCPGRMRRITSDRLLHPD